MASFRERLEGELRGKEPSQVVELMLDHIPAANNLEGSGLTDEFVGLKKLSLNGVGLTTLKHLPVLSSLRKLGENRLSSSAELERLVTCCKNLTHLNIVNNKFKDISSLDALCLRVLNMESNPVAHDASYRKALFSLIPTLQFVDDEDRAGNPIPSDDSDDEEEEEDGEEGEEDEDGEGADDGAEDDVDDEAGAEEEVGLSYLQGDINEDEDAGEDFEPQEGEGDEDAEEEGDDDEEDEDEHPSKRSKSGWDA